MEDDGIQAATLAAIAIIATDCSLKQRAMML
jgi:hypothetical protein